MKSNNWLIERLTGFSNKTAMVWHDVSVTYAEMLGNIQYWLNKLKEENINKGDIVILSADCTPKSCGLLLALFINENTVVPMVPSALGLKEKYLALTQAKFSIEIIDDANYKIDSYSSITTHPLLKKLQEDNKPGLVLFSSGSSGESKAMLLDVNSLLKKYMGSRPAQCTLFFLLLDHIGGINTLLHVLSQGGTLVIPNSKSPDAICEAIQNHQVALLPTTPTFLTMLLMSDIYKKYDMSSLSLVSYGTEPMPLSTLNKLNSVFPGLKFKQTYGLSELGILPTKSENPNSVWFLMGDDLVKYKIVDKLLLIKSPTAMLGYLNAPNPFDSEGWFNTGDLVETKITDNKEYIRIIGRKSEIINVGGLKVYPAEVEDVLLKMDNIADVVVFGKSNPITGQVVAAMINVLKPEESRQLQKRVKDFCKDKMDSYKIPMLIKIVEHNLYGARFKKARQIPANILNTKLEGEVNV